MTEPFSPHAVQRFAASDGATFTAPSHASAPGGMAYTPMVAVSQAERRARLARLCTWKYAIVSLTAALLPAYIAIVELNGAQPAARLRG